MKEIDYDFQPTEKEIIEAAKYCSSIHQYCYGCVFQHAHEDGFMCVEYFAEYIIRNLQKHCEENI